MPLQKIRLELARDHEFPQGSNQHGYEFIAPLDSNGLLDAALWKQHREASRVTRFWGDDEHETGHLIRKPGGSWAFHYDVQGDPDDDESGYRLGGHAFLLGEYVSIRDEDDKLVTFRVVAVEDVPERAS